MKIEHNPNFIQQLNGKLTKFRPIAWVFAKTMHHFDRAVYRLSGGRATAASALAGLPIVILMAKGAKSGKTRETPLIVTPHGDELILVASNYGNTRHPAWYHNLKANPDCEIKWNGRILTYVAREAEGEEKAACWRLATQIFPTYDIYKMRTAGRVIPLMILSPRAAG